MKFFHHFSLGVATLFDLAGHLTTENRDARSQCSDAEAIYSDWLAVFGDLQDAFQTVTEVSTRQDQPGQRDDRGDL